MEISGRTFAISDIHGCFRTFYRLVRDEIELQKEDRLYLMGDLIDRGNDSKGVVDFIMQLQDEGYSVFTLRGNHEQIMMDSIANNELFDLWIQNGGDTTLKSFGVKSYKDLHPRYKSFFNRTEFYLSHENYLLVHAGLNFNNPDLLEDKEAMLWIRNMEVDLERLGDRIILHGHTPMPLDYIVSQLHHTEINIDGGCVYKKRKGLGNLVAYNLTECKFHHARNID